uniref:Uncharacterized protein n=1 Tax=Arundo donax TaxID=35708 RepID=A0A0A8Y901_ARUDO
MNNIGESGSPCRSPRRCQIYSSRSSLRSALVDAEERSSHTMLYQERPKPRWRRTSRRNGQGTESKAFEMSSFRRILGSLC